MRKARAGAFARTSGVLVSVAIATAFGWATTSYAQALPQRPAPDSRPATVSPTPAIALAQNAAPPSGCIAVGTVAEQIATWRDAHGAESLARFEVRQRLSDADARDVGLAMVSQLYTGFAKDLTPQEAQQAYTAACAAGAEKHQ